MTKYSVKFFSESSEVLGETIIEHENKEQAILDAKSLLIDPFVETTTEDGTIEIVMSSKVAKFSISEKEELASLQNQ